MNAFKNAKQNSDKQNAHIEHDKALARVLTALLVDDTELFKQLSDNPSFRKALADRSFAMTYRDEPAADDTSGHLRPRGAVNLNLDSRVPQVSEMIAATVEAGLVKRDESVGTSRKHARYVPIWA